MENIVYYKDYRISSEDVEEARKKYLQMCQEILDEE